MNSGSPTDDDRADARRIALVGKEARKFVGMPGGGTNAATFARSLGVDFISLGEDLGTLNMGLRQMLDGAMKDARGG